VRTALRAAVPVWAAWLAGVVGLVALAVATGAIASDRDATGMPGTVRDGLLWPLRSWDFAWYERLAQGGYPEDVVLRQHAFFPLWPWLLGLGHPECVGAALAVLASAAAFGAVAALNPVGDARATAIALACLPGSFALAMLYPDALALACGAWACVLASRPGARPWMLALAALLGAAAGTARPNAFLLAIPLAWLAWRGGGRLRWLVAAAPLGGAAAVHGFLWQRTGDPLAFLHAQQRWRRGEPWDLVWGVPGNVASGHFQTLAEIAVGAFAIGLCVILWRRDPKLRVWALYAGAVLALSLGSGSWQSIGRQTLFAFPLAWAAAGHPAFRRRRVVLAGIAVNAALILALPWMTP
jgi:hypothetical protein